jgi:hypothetical protein
VVMGRVVARDGLELCVAALFISVVMLICALRCVSKTGGGLPDHT